jgi:hypothetical protein
MSASDPLADIRLFRDHASCRRRYCALGRRNCEGKPRVPAFRAMFGTKLIPLLFNLYTNPREDTEKVITDSWISGPVLKMVGEFEASVKKHPLIAMGTPDPYMPPR